MDWKKIILSLIPALAVVLYKLVEPSMPPFDQSTFVATLVWLVELALGLTSGALLVGNTVVSNKNAVIATAEHELRSVRTENLLLRNKEKQLEAENSRLKKPVPITKVKPQTKKRSPRQK